VGWQRSRRDASARRSYFAKMAYAPKHPCSYPGCVALISADKSRCEMHRSQEQREHDRQRGSSASRGYDRKWRAARRSFLQRNPLCVECLKKGIPRVANVVDHVNPHKGDPMLFWDQSNWQSLCSSCHSRKTAVSDGRWG
jgi:5-methylcytosine-specific restriction enzyme A